MDWFDACLFFTIIFLAFVLGYINSGNKKPMFAMKCEKCGAKDKDWAIVPIGHDEFAWQHNCKKGKI